MSTLKVVNSFQFIYVEVLTKEMVWRIRPGRTISANGFAEFLRTNLYKQCLEVEEEAKKIY